MSSAAAARGLAADRDTRSMPERGKHKANDRTGLRDDLLGFVGRAVLWRRRTGKLLGASGLRGAANKSSRWAWDDAADLTVRKACT
jgi:hypothetical protein